uniref:Uncharacterized protein LOC100186474 n=1 Tax=Phallusia mammillata TaxID=59560 RepID=A0A6F9DHS3_9ASCI|nr:uncharacterized protein LOC100186474 [Phallusia mammillata]
MCVTHLALHKKKIERLSSVCCNIGRYRFSKKLSLLRDSSIKIYLQQIDVNMSINYAEKSKFLKRKLKYLVYEHESLKSELEKAQRKLLKVSRDNSFLLDRLLQYEQVIVDSPIDSDATVSSDSDSEVVQHQKRKATSASQSGAAKQIKSEAQEKPKEMLEDETNIIEGSAKEPPSLKQDSPRASHTEEDVIVKKENLNAVD